MSDNCGLLVYDELTWAGARTRTNDDTKLSLVCVILFGQGGTMSWEVAFLGFLLNFVLHEEVEQNSLILKKIPTKKKYLNLARMLAA